MALLELAWSVAMYLFGVILAMVAAVFFTISLLKLALIKIYCAIKGETFDVLAGPDAAFLLNIETHFSDPSCGSMVQAVLFLKGRLDFPLFRQKISERVVKARNVATGLKEFPRLSQRPVRRYGYWVWEETKDFSTDHHVVLHDEGYTDLASLVHMLQVNSNKPFPEDRPLWYIAVVPQLTEDGSWADNFVMVLRGSHSMIDGMGLLRIFSLAADETSKKTLEEIIKAFHLNKSCLPPLFKHNALLRYLALPDETLNVTKIVDIVKNAVWIILQAPWLMALNQIYRDKNGLHGPLNNGRKLVAVSESIDLQLMKDVATAFGCTVSDVYYSCLVGSCWRCDPTPSDSLRVSSTVLIRKPGNAYSENVFSCFTPIFPTTHGDDVVARLKCVSQVAQNWKMSPEPIVNLMAVSCLSVHCPFFIGSRLCQNYRPTAVASNLHGPPFPLSMSGYTADDIFFITPTIAHIGVSFSFASYNGKIRVGVVVDKAVAPNDCIAHQLVACFVQELKQLHAIANDS